MGLDFKNITSAVKEVGSMANNVKSQYEEVKGVVGQVRSIAQNPLGLLDNAKGKLKDVLQFDSESNLFGESTGDDGGSSGSDIRVRLRPMQLDQVYGASDKQNNILDILRETNGMMFPYTPTIDWSQTVEYQTTSLSHTNQEYQAYRNTPSTTFRVSGDFTVQNYREGQYMLAVIHFLRTVSKMHFGKTSKTPGMPPPVLLFSGYGDYMFNDLPVILKEHSYSLGKDNDYIDIDTANGIARLPTVMQIAITLVVQNTPKKMREEFNLDDFRTGKLMKSKGWI